MILESIYVLESRRIVVVVVVGVYLEK